MCNSTEQKVKCQRLWRRPRDSTSAALLHPGGRERVTGWGWREGDEIRGGGGYEGAVTSSPAWSGRQDSWSLASAGVLEAWGVVTCLGGNSSPFQFAALLQLFDPTGQQRACWAKCCAQWRDGRHTSRLTCVYSVVGTSWSSWQPGPASWSGTSPWSEQSKCIINQNPLRHLAGTMWCGYILEIKQYLVFYQTVWYVLLSLM